MSEPANIEVVLFDIGGVIVQMGDFAMLGPFGDIRDNEGIRRIWLESPIVDAHERGLIEHSEFAARMVETYSIACTPPEFLDRCIAWHGELFAEVEDTIAALDPSLRVGCLSNTCAYHWRNQPCAARIDELFETQFLSFRMGAMKPEAEIYRRVAEQLERRPETILFFDDTERNVVGARAVGFQAHRVAGMGEVKLILEDYGLLRAGKTSSGST